MTITPLDWAIVAAYFLFCTGIGLFFTKRGGQSLDQYFLSGRQVPWWLAGTALVATTFAADTPLVVTALVATKGVAGNWLWWNFVMSGMLTVFFFARLWRRAEGITDGEVAGARHDGQRRGRGRGHLLRHHGDLRGGGGHVGRHVDGPRPVHRQDERGHRARGLFRARGGRDRRAQDQGDRALRERDG